MSTNDRVASTEQGLAIEKLQHLEAYFREREQEDALRLQRRQRAARIHQIDAELRAIEAGRDKAAQIGKGGDA